MLWLSYHGLGKISQKMSQMAREMCVQVREKVRELFFQIFEGHPY